jgi:hypothetical protein
MTTYRRINYKGPIIEVSLDREEEAVETIIPDPIQDDVLCIIEKYVSDL